MGPARILALVVLVAILAAALALTALARTASPRFHPGGAGIAAQHKGEADANNSAQVVGQRGEGNRGPQGLAEEQAVNRALPLDTVPLAQTQGAQAGFAAGEQHTQDKNKSRPQWSLLGPSIAKQPGVLSFTGADEVESGRVTSLAIGPTCNESKCQLWSGAAGGGVWRTDNALAGTPTWSSKSKGLPTNAIGSLLLTRGGVLYAGTGEPNASGDSEAGLGLYKSTNGGDSWTLVPGSYDIARERAISSIAVDPTNPNQIYISTARAIRGVSSVTGGSITPPDAPPMGVFASSDGGNTFTQIWAPDPAIALRGVNKLELDPQNPQTVYAAAFGMGLWRSGDNNSAFQQVFVPGSAINVNRTEFALTVKDGHTRGYVGDGAVGTPASPASSFWRNDNLDDGPPFTWKRLSDTLNGTPGYASHNYCTGQCWYDNAVVTPAGSPDTVYLLGSFQYGEFAGRSNGRAVLRSTTAGEPDPANKNRTFTDMTWDATSADTPNGIHPDQHALVVAPGNPNLFFEGSDGGVIRSDGFFEDVSSQCSGRKVQGKPLSPASLLTCQRLLSAVPKNLYHLNAGLPTLQFQSLSVSPNGQEIMGGTQDNGTWLFKGDRTTWNQSIYGDGGQSGFDVAKPAIRFNSFFFSATDTNFQGGDPEKWVVTSGPLLQSGERSAFYSPEIADPVLGGSMFIGLQHVWRTTDNGGNQAFLEASCPEFTADADDPKCGDWKPLGNDLTSPASGNRSGSFVVAIARSATDSSTMWAATRLGRVFVTHNADAADAATVQFDRVDSLAANSPGRFVSGIVVDPANPNHTWISYSGYNASTAATPGHVFEVALAPASGGQPASATWTDLGVENFTGDLPITGLVRATDGTLYASTDFGVLRQSIDDNDWEVAGQGLPTVEVAGMTLSPDGTKIYAATHGRGAWVLPIK